MSLAIGLMSGTSADGVTAALVEIKGRGLKVRRYKTFPYAPSLRQRVLKASFLTAPELSRLNFELGEAFARAAIRIKGRSQVSAIGSHGQTVWHGPNASPPNTLQIAEPAVIAERASMTVVADFRPRDMAAGGQGAPLVPAFDLFLFGKGPLRCAQNIGGIGNVSVAGRGRVWTAFDTGPGNSLLDEAARQGTEGRWRMDKNGKIARQGKPDERLLARLLAQPYFRLAPPKSLDKESFGAKFLSRHFGKITRQRLPDVLATLALFTARSIADSYHRFIFPKHDIKEIVVSGGGALNPVLMGHLRRLMAPRPVKTSDTFGVPVMAKEAACFAWLAMRALQGRPNNCPNATGCPGPRILGKIIPA